MGPSLHNLDDRTPWISALAAASLAVSLYLFANSAASNTALGTRKFIRVILVAPAIGGLIFRARAIPVSEATPGQPLRALFGHDVLRRALHPVEEHEGNPRLFMPPYLDADEGMR